MDEVAIAVTGHQSNVSSSEQLETQLNIQNVQGEEGVADGSRSCPGECCDAGSSLTEFEVVSS
jgi:hypothetical protein